MTRTFRCIRCTPQRDGRFLVVYRDGPMTRQATAFEEIREGDTIHIVSGLAQRPMGAK